jgi:hypothetical protein
MKKKAEYAPENLVIMFFPFFLSISNFLFFIRFRIIGTFGTKKKTTNGHFSVGQGGGSKRKVLL